MPPFLQTIAKKHPRIFALISARCFWLLVLLVGMLLLSGALSTTPRGRILGSVALAFTVLVVPVAVRASPQRRLITVLLLVLPITGWAYYIVTEQQWALALCQSGFLLNLLFAIFCTLDFVLARGLPSGEHILGAICGYILIAMFFTTIYTLCWIHIPGAFSGVGLNSPRPWGDLLYFSVTTLSTVGYGDIAPVAPIPRSAAMIEQLTGTFYLALLIARLTGLYPQTLPAPAAGPDKNTP